MDDRAEAARRDARALGLDVSAKAILLDAGRVLLVRNHRHEWELPGGRPEGGETLADAVAREVREETGLDVSAGRFVDYWDYEITVENATVRVISFVATLERPGAAVLGAEHTELGWHPLDAVPSLPMPEGYKRSIARAVS